MVRRCIALHWVNWIELRSILGWTTFRNHAVYPSFQHDTDFICSLDSIGIAGFGHNFHAIEGHESPVVEVFESFGSTDTSIISQLVFFLGPVFPMLQKLPTKRNRMFKRLRTTIRGISDELLERNRREKAGLSTGETDKSIIGLLGTSSYLGIFYLDLKKWFSQGWDF